MGERGPGKTPTKLKLLHGERRRSRLNAREPKVAGKAVMPADMSEAAKVVWRRVMRAIGASGVITAADVDIARAYCEAVVRYHQAARTLEDTGPVVRGARKGDLVKNPLHQIVRDNVVIIRALARELGLTPSSRAGLTSPGEPGADPFNAWLEGTGS